MELDIENANRVVADAYNKDSFKPEIVAFKDAVRNSRKYGFPIVSSLQGETEKEKLIWAAKLLLTIARTYPLECLQDDFELIQGTKLYSDAKQLLANAEGNTERMSVTSGK